MSITAVYQIYWQCKMPSPFEWKCLNPVNPLHAVRQMRTTKTRQIVKTCRVWVPTKHSNPTRWDVQNPHQTAEDRQTNFIDLLSKLWQPVHWLLLTLLTA